MPATPHLVRWQKEYAARGLQIVAVYRKGKDDTLDRLKALVKEKGMEFPIVFDAEGKSSDAYGIRALPVAYLLDADGVVVWEGIMVKSKKDAKGELEAALKDQIEKLKGAIPQEDLAARIDDLIPRLASESVAERSAAQADLRRLVESNPKAARPLLKSRIASATDAEVRQALKASLDLLPALELEIELEGEARIDRPLALKVRIRNVSDEDRIVVRSLDGSDAGARYPRIEVQIVGPDGTNEVRPLAARGSDLKPLTPGDFIAVSPGKEMDPLGDGGAAHGVLKSWRPARAGRYTVTIGVDYTERNIGHWIGTAAMQDSYLNKLEGLLSRVPKLKFEAKTVVEVKR